MISTRAVFVLLSGVTITAQSALLQKDYVDTGSSVAANSVFLYAMDVNPSTLDLDGNSTIDYFAGAAGSQTIPQTYSGGIGSSSQSAAIPENLFRTDIGGSITRSVLLADSPFTLEWSVRKTGGAQGADGWFGVAAQNPGATYAARVNFEDDRVSYLTSEGNADYLVGTNFADGEFHTARLAKALGDNYFVWIDGVLLNEDEDSGWTGGNPSFNTAGSWFIGDFSGGLGGDWDVDYIAFDANGAFAPIPEPSGLVLMAAGLIGLSILRRRRSGC